MGQGLGTLFGMITGFAVVFIILSFGIYIPEDIVASTIVADFMNRADLEIKLAIVGTVLYPPYLGQQLAFGARASTVLMAVAWGTAGLVAGLLARDVVAAIFASVFAVFSGAFLTWLLIFFITSADISLILGGPSMLLLQFILEGCIYPCIAALIGGLLGGGISRKR